MKFPIGLRLFLALLCSSFAVAAISLLLLSGSVLNVFSDYTVKIDLDRLDEIANDISSSYAQKGDWSFLPTTAEERRYWFGVSFNRINQEKIDRQNKQNETPEYWETDPRNALPPPPPSELIPGLPQTRVGTSTSTSPEKFTKPNINSHQIVEHHSKNTNKHEQTSFASIQPSPSAPPTTVTPATPGVPQAPPAPPAPPSPPPLPAPPSSLESFKDSGLDPYSVADPALLAKNGDLYLRVTLLDRQSRYLAGLKEKHDGKDYRMLFAHGQFIGYLLVKRSNSRPDEVTNRFLSAYRDTIIRFVILSVILSAILATILAIHFRRPLIRLRNGTQQLAEGQFTTRLDIRRSDELGELADNFNLLAEKLESVEKERRLWVADTSHELRTPVSVIRAQIEAFQDGVRTPTSENLELLLRQILALDKLINDLYLHAQIDSETYQLHTEDVDLVDCFNEVCRSYEEKLKRADLQFTFSHSIPEALIVHIDRQRLVQVLSNLLENSIRYTATPGKITLNLTDELASIQIRLEDSAPGLNQDQLKQLGQRFYRPDAGRSRQHGGSGLGLSLCVRLIRAHGGEIQFEQAHLGGLAVRINLPKQATLVAEKGKGQ